MSLFTAQTARDMAARSLQSRLANKERRELAKLEPAPSPLTDRIKRTEHQLDEIDDEIERAPTGKDKLALIRSKAELLKAWQLLTGFPSPGTRKGSKSSLAIQNPIPQPVQSKPVTE